MTEPSVTHAQRPSTPSGEPGSPRRATGDGEPPRRSVPRAALLGLALVAAVGLGYVVGYEQYASRPAKVIAATPARSCPAAPPASPGEVRINGVVEGRTDTSFTMRESAKARTRVTVTLGSAPVCRTVAAGLTDLQSGDHVAVRGTQTASGVDAATVTVSGGTGG